MKKTRVQLITDDQAEDVDVLTSADCVTFSDGDTFQDKYDSGELKGQDGLIGKDGIDGKDGKDGVTPHIGENGHWYLGSQDTGVKAKGEDGADGADGQDGSIPTIGDNGNWFIDGKDTLSPSRGAQGDPGPQGEKGLKGDTGSQGEQGPQGLKGDPGDTPNITINASVDDNVGTPSVEVVKSGTDEDPVFNLNFKNLKGESSVDEDEILGIKLKAIKNYDNDVVVGLDVEKMFVEASQNYVVSILPAVVKKDTGEIDSSIGYPLLNLYPGTGMALRYVSNRLFIDSTAPQILSGAEEPTASQGNDGDIYIMLESEE